ncbi:uncharacterized protein BDZ99DRAFT_479152 [Mytilinidion resinicola]|uniref:Uncharacterized protein n=1 Tax=Mytilinidion resinicola TaxID=574789 RepID=A0A6A6YFF2_9PEZI|nr:uncharacterized protein BDZ99DRAFT_479152 [Mytilinidion resinicola]KAF2806754.1 hypothetical protein BDZ99DRAFT_479152 [Mytilinidion resinicola]
MSSSAPPRRFKAEPIETTVKSSRNAAPKQSETADSSKPAEASPKATRRFAPQPVETTTKSNRKFAAEPFEFTSRSSKAKPEDESSSKKPRKFSPEPIETTTASSRTKAREKDEASNAKALEASSPENSAASQTSEKKPRRRFTPQLIETAKRTRKAGDTGPAILPSDKTEATPGDGQESPRKARIRPPPAPPGNTPTASVHVPHFLDIDRARSPLSLRSSSRGSVRSRHSFRVPDLEPIESSESEGSIPPSLSTSPSASSDQSYMYKEATRMRESVDDRFSGYLLELAARAAEKQLRDQAMAAFPNDDYHEPVDHFINQELDDTSVIMSSDERESYDEAYGRRESSSFKTVNWELLAMQQHRERLEQERESERQRETQAQAGRPALAQSPWGNPASAMFTNSSANRNIIGGWQKDGELERMRSGAKPPMLGSDIEFPRCSSPEPARFDPTQGSHALKNSMCYLTEQTQQESEPEGLWHCKETSSNRASLWSQPNSRTPSAGGLWGGFCQAGTGNTPPRGPSGLMTPMVEVGNPFEISSPPSSPVKNDLPPSPPPSNPDITSIDDRLSNEIALQKEFSDDFVTQVYNYLSLGYPSIARNFDGELSKISRIPILELRQDDHLATSRGYIRLGEDGNLRDSEITEETCVRWKALRSYIQEWARQQPKMSPVDGTMGVGVAVRRGSWAF